jgi:hypothetical protein
LVQTLAEAERVAAKGVRTVSFPDSPVPLGLPSFHSDHWDSLWWVCAQAQMPVSLHFGSGGFVPGFSFWSMPLVNPDLLKTMVLDAPFAVAITLFSDRLMWSAVDLLFSRKLQQFPDLQFSLAEGGIGWVPYILERSDFVWERHRYYQSIDSETRPSDLFRQHFRGCIIDDEHGLAKRHTIGIDRIMLEIDYPPFGFQLAQLRQARRRSLSRRAGRRVRVDRRRERAANAELSQSAGSRPGLRRGDLTQRRRSTF